MNQHKESTLSLQSIPAHNRPQNRKLARTSPPQTPRVAAGPRPGPRASVRLAVAPIAPRGRLNQNTAGVRLKVSLMGIRLEASRARPESSTPATPSRPITWAGAPTASVTLFPELSTSLQLRPTLQEVVRTPESPATGVVLKAKRSNPQPALIEGIQPASAGCQ